jgi:hypothetical protein
MKKQFINRYFFFSGLSLVVLSVIMFISGAGMFVSRGNYSKIILKLSELCIVFWLPFLILGIVLIILGISLTIYKSNRK